MQLASEGILDLTKPLAQYLELPNPGDARSRLITATHVLSHSGGWRNWRNNRETLLTADFEPGSRFSYSGEGYYFLQRVVEKLTGKGLQRLARERVFEPLGMRTSSYIWRPELDAVACVAALESRAADRQPQCADGQGVRGTRGRAGEAGARVDRR
jgi:CubicO group peptidase (beta-lactamase class C family)